jgi:pSer/pThr/pTyr-binding forkhead associated (FHA) protein
VSAVVVLILRILIAVVLYAFAAYAFYLLWKTIRKPAEARSESGIPVLTLHPARKAGMEVQRFEIEDVLVGREKGCQLCLADDTVSARHARLSYHNKQWWVEDLGSTNGSFLNKTPVTTPTVLAKNDTLTFGKVSLVVKFE